MPIAIAETMEPWMDSRELTEKIRQAALADGAALIGFGPVERFANAPPQHHPHAIFPATRTAIAIAIPHLRGSLKAVEDGCYWQSYIWDNYGYLNEMESPRILRRIAWCLEEHGYMGVPIHNPFFSGMGRQIRGDQPWGPDGKISLRVLGVACGLGELGMSKMFLTPQFGPRQRVFGVLTDAELEPTPMFEGSVCDGCLQCARECEAGAIGNQRTETFRIEGREFGHAKFDCGACVRIHTGQDPTVSPFWNGSEKEGETTAFSQRVRQRFNHLSHCVGRGCLRACIDHLEKTGRITRQYHTPLIEDKRWRFTAGPDAQKKAEWV